MIMWFLFFIRFMCYIVFIDLCMLNQPYIPGMKPTWSWYIIFSMLCWIQFAGVCVYWEFLCLCSSRKLVYNFLFLFFLSFFLSLCMSLSSFGIRSYLQSGNSCLQEFDTVPSLSILWNSLRGTGVSVSLKADRIRIWHSIHQTLGFSLLGDYYWRIRLPLLVTDLFGWFTSSWFNFSRSHASRNLSISSRFPSLLEYKFLKCS
jgi:hypothetical protein